MPVFDAKNLDREFEGQALLGALLHPTRGARTRALRLGRRRAERNSMMAAPSATEPRSPMTGDDLTPVTVPST